MLAYSRDSILILIPNQGHITVLGRKIYKKTLWELNDYVDQETHSCISPLSNLKCIKAHPFRYLLSCCGKSQRKIDMGVLEVDLRLRGRQMNK